MCLPPALPPRGDLSKRRIFNTSKASCCLPRLPAACRGRSALQDPFCCLSSFLSLGTPIPWPLCQMEFPSFLQTSRTFSNLPHWDPCLLCWPFSLCFTVSFFVESSFHFFFSLWFCILMQFSKKWLLWLPSFCYWIWLWKFSPVFEKS